MTQLISDKLLHVILEIICHYEETHEHELSTADKDFLIRTITKDVPASIEKFILGGKEHNANGDSDFVTGVRHLEELLKENHDSKFYIAAAIECARAKKQ